MKKAVADAKRNLVTVPLNKNNSFPHRIDGIFGAAKVGWGAGEGGGWRAGPGGLESKARDGTAFVGSQHPLVHADHAVCWACPHTCKLLACRAGVQAAGALCRASIEIPRR